MRDMDQLMARLRMIARECTEGTWKATNGMEVTTSRGVIAEIPTPKNGGVFDCSANMNWIAEASPENILKLLDHIEGGGSYGS